MKFKRIYIKNFRNFKNIDVKLDNKNIIFGMNDVGKTNFLSSIRFLLDAQYRSSGFKDSDFHQFNTQEDIIIGIEIDISDHRDDEDSQLIIQKMIGSRSKGDTVIIQLTGKYNKEENFGEFIMEWGSSQDSLDAIPPQDRGSNRYVIDKIFNVQYIDSFLNLERVFKKYNKAVLASTLVQKDNNENSEMNKTIDESIKNLEEAIKNHPFINEQQRELEQGYKLFRPNDEDVQIQLKPEIAIKGYADTLLPYIHKSEDNNHLYPTNGDGRKKLLSYALIYINILHNSEIYNKKTINIFLLEEPENHLHFSLQKTLSKQLFNNKEVFKYLFMTTHSSKMLNYLNDAQLIKIQNKDSNNICADSVFYNLEDIFKKSEEKIDFNFCLKKLNRQLSEAIFYKSVLLVEGGSEYWLFNSIYEKIGYDLELNDKCILQIDGIGFKPYLKIFKALDIECIVKTDNDLKQSKNKKEINLLGLNRGRSLIEEEKLQNIPLDKEDKLSEEQIFDEKKHVFENYKTEITDLKEKGIYLSKVDLESDLYEANQQLINKWLKEETSYQFTYPFEKIRALQKHKVINMAQLLSYLTVDDARKILNNDNFEVLKVFKDI